MSYTHADDCVARLGSSRVAAPTTIDADEAARLLQVTRKAVVQMAISGALPGTLVEIERDARAPTWARLAELNGWKTTPEVVTRSRRPARKPDVTRPPVQVWRFRRADVLALRDKRAAEQERHEAIKEFQLVRVFARDPSPKRFIPRQPKRFSPRFQRLPRLSRSRNINAGANHDG